jgi:hypothetical protein
MKASSVRRDRSRYARLCAAVQAVLLLSTGCVSTHPRPPPPEPELILLSAAAPIIPPDCGPAPGVVYRTSFNVQADGSVARATPSSSDGCVQLALQQWVTSFRYQPPGRQIPSVIDWMQVTAERGP